MLNQARIDGLLKYMDQIGLSQMLIPQSGAGTVLCGDYTTGCGTVPPFCMYRRRTASS